MTCSFTNRNAAVEASKSFSFLARHSSTLKMEEILLTILQVVTRNVPRTPQRFATLVGNGSDHSKVFQWIVFTAQMSDIRLRTVDQCPRRPLPKPAKTSIVQVGDTRCTMSPVPAPQSTQPAPISSSAHLFVRLSAPLPRVLHHRRARQHQFPRQVIEQRLFHCRAHFRPLFSRQLQRS